MRHGVEVVPDRHALMQTAAAAFAEAGRAAIAATAAALGRFAKARVDLNAVAAELQRDGAAAFVASWKELLACLVEKSTILKKAG
jgi:hypothetical protein